METFKAKMMDIFTKTDTDKLKLISTSKTFTLKEAKTISLKKYCVVRTNKDVSNAIPDSYIRYLISIEMEKDSTICIEKTLPYLIVSIFLTLIFSIIFDFSFGSSYKKNIFFAINLFIFLPINFFLIKNFYNKIHSNKNTHEDIETYIIDSTNNTKDDPRILLKYQNNSVQFGKLYQYYVGAYFIIIITFTFYCASLMHTIQQ